MKELESYYPNPQTLEFNPFGCYIADEKSFKDYVDDYKQIMRYLKKMSDWGDPFALDIKSFKNFDEYVENLDGGIIDSEGFMKDLLSAGALVSFYISDINKVVKNGDFTQKLQYPPETHFSAYIQKRRGATCTSHF